MNIDLRQLQYFVATADAGSATRAAPKLHVTQPVLSRQLRRLEQQIGLRLFERSGRRLRLTRAGEEFLLKARPLLHGAASLEAAARSLASGQVQQLHIAVPATTLTDVVAPFIATLDPAGPVPLLRSLDPGGAAAAIAAGADLAIVHRPPPRELASRPLAVLPVFAYVRRDDPWMDRKGVDLAELLSRPLVLMTDRFRPRQLLDRAVDAAGWDYGDILECTNAQVAQALAAAGRGIAVVSDDPRFGLLPLAIDAVEGPVQIRLYAAWDRNHFAAGTMAALADRLAAFCVDRYGKDASPRPAR